MKHHVRLVLAVTAASLLGLVATPAHANKYVYNDATADVVSVTGASETMAPAPERTNGDIAYSKVNHRARKVVLTLRYRDLEGVGLQSHFFSIRTPTFTRDVYVVAASGFWGGKAFMQTPRGKRVRCHLAKKIDYTTNTVTVSVPRTCLDKPRWVKVAMAQVSFDSVESETIYADDARVSGRLLSRPVYGPRVRR